LTGDLLIGRGAKLGDHPGSIRVVLGHDIDPRLRSIFLNASPDHRIVDTALRLQHRESSFHVVLVSKDTNLRMKAKARGVPVQDYSSDKVESKQIYKGKRTAEADPVKIDDFYCRGSSISGEALGMDLKPNANENFVLRQGSKSRLATYRKSTNTYQRVKRTECYGINPANSEQSFALQSLTDPTIKLITLTDRAGTGKTILFLAAALHCRGSKIHIRSSHCKPEIRQVPDLGPARRILLWCVTFGQ
jgi:PhoH-like ATPase